MYVYVRMWVCSPRDLTLAIRFGRKRPYLPAISMNLKTILKYTNQPVLESTHLYIFAIDKMCFKKEL